MPVPNAYTEEDLAKYMLAVLADTATSLGWDAVSFLDEAVISTLIRVGVTAIEDVAADKIGLLRSAARVEAWSAVASATAGDYDFDADATSIKRSQMHKQALEMMQKEKEAFDYLIASSTESDFVASIVTVTHSEDPYEVRDETLIGW